MSDAQKPDNNGVKPRPGLVVEPTTDAELAAREEARRNNPRVRELNKPSTVEQAVANGDPISNIPGPPNPAGTPAGSTPRPSAVTISPEEQDANAARHRAEAANNPIAGDWHQPVDGQAVRGLGAPPSPPASQAIAPAAAVPQPVQTESAPGKPLEITPEAEEALGKLQTELMAALKLRGENTVEILANATADLGYGALAAMANGQAAMSLVEKIQSPDKMDPALRQQIIAKINDPEQRGPALAQFLDEVKEDPSVLKRMNEDPGMLLALGAPVTPQPATVAAAAPPSPPPLPSNPIPDVPPPVDMLQASLQDPDWNRQKAEELARQQPPVPPSDPVRQDFYNPAAQAIAAQESKRKAEAEAAAAPPAPATEPPAVTADTQKLRDDVMAAMGDLLKDDDAKKLLASAMRDQDVALFIGRQTGIDLSDYGSEEGGGLDPAKIQAKLEAMSDDQLKATKDNIAAGKKYIEENRMKVQAFNAMPENAQNSLATGANALAGFQDKLGEMGNNLMGGLMKNIGSIFSGGGLGNLFDGIDLGGMLKQLMGMVTGMIGKFTGSDTMNTLSNMGGQMVAGLTETLGAATGQKPGEQITYDVDGRRIDPKAPAPAAAQQPQRPGQQQPGQPQPGTAAS